jgi:hypothetical protein
METSASLQADRARIPSKQSSLHKQRARAVRAEEKQNQIDRMMLADARVAFDGIKKDLAGGFVRVFQFVKTLAPPSEKMLVDYMLRASGIVCNDGQPGIDLVIPIRCAPSEDPQHACKLAPEGGASPPEGIAGTSALLVQVKLRSDPLEPAQKQRIVSGIHKSKAGLHSRSLTNFPFVGLCLELDPTSQRQKRVTIDRTEGHTIFLSGFSPSDLLPLDELTQKAFERLLITTTNPAKSLHVLSTAKAKVEQVFRTQPYSINDIDE